MYDDGNCSYGATMANFSRLEQLFTLAGFANLAEFAMAAGIRENTAQKHKDRDSIPYARAVDYLRAAERAGVSASVDWLLDGTGAPPARVSATPVQIEVATNPKSRLIPHNGKAQLIERQSPYPLPPRQNVRIRETIEQLGGGFFMLTERVIDSYASPDTGERAFAFYVQDDAAEPYYDRGDRVLVNPDMPLVVGKDVLLLADPDAEGRQKGILCRLLAISAEKWTVRRFTREKETFVPRSHHLSRKEWPLAHRVVGARNA